MKDFANLKGKPQVKKYLNIILDDELLSKDDKYRIKIVAYQELLRLNQIYPIPRFYIQLADICAFKEYARVLIEINSYEGHLKKRLLLLKEKSKLPKEEIHLISSNVNDLYFQKRKCGCSSIDAYKIAISYINLQTISKYNI